MVNHPNRSRAPTVNLYGEDGIAVYLSAYHDICDRDEAVVRVVGHDLYHGSVEEAERSIRRAYLDQTNTPDPLA
jgi:hypothetical protein